MSEMEGVGYLKNCDNGDIHINKEILRQNLWLISCGRANFSCMSNLNSPYIPCDFFVNLLHFLAFNKS